MEKEQLKSKIKDMQAFLQVRADEPHAMLERMELLEILMAQAGECIAISRQHQDHLVAEMIEKHINDGLPPSVLTKFVNALCADWNFIVTSFERINATAVHQHDGLRTRISYLKCLQK